MLTNCKIFVSFLLLFLGQEILANNALVTDFRFSVYPDKTRLVFDINGEASYIPTILPDKISINIKRAIFMARGKIKITNFSPTPIKTIASVRNGSDLQLSLVLRKPVKLRHFFLSKPNRLVLDLYPVERTESKEPKANLSLTSTVPNVKTNEDSVESGMLLEGMEKDLINKIAQIEPKDSNLRRVVVVIDPGHGGIDSGAIGYHGTREKDVTLAVAKALQKIVNNMPGFHAVLTRDADYFIPLRGRLGIARNRKADMFISIHADAYMNKEAHGISIFALSQRGATSEAARWLAEKENESELGRAISDKNTLLRSVLIDLAQTATISASLDIGRKMLQALVNFASLHAKEVEQAAFVVLKSPDIPSLLVEVGFLTYPDEEKKLCTSRYQEEIAARLSSGIQAYFIHHPPPNTYLATMRPHGDLKVATLQDSLPSGNY